ncbi:MAG: hypothetical protein IPK12_02800 [Gemmatimonadetes bacterium]|nr:hypothetical protein [Gemmatimonadota bacterium]
MALALAAALPGCGSDEAAPKTKAPAKGEAPADPAQADAQALGAEVFDIMDRVVAYKASHQGRLPTSFRQAGIDTLTATTTRGLSRVGGDPQVTIRFRRMDGHQLESCSGTNVVIEQSMMNEGTFEVQCVVADGATRTFTVRRP